MREIIELFVKDYQQYLMVRVMVSHWCYNLFVLLIPLRSEIFHSNVKMMIYVSRFIKIIFK